MLDHVAQDDEIELPWREPVGGEVPILDRQAEQIARGSGVQSAWLDPDDFATEFPSGEQVGTLAAADIERPYAGLGPQLRYDRP